MKRLGLVALFALAGCLSLPTKPPRPAPPADRSVLIFGHEGTATGPLIDDFDVLVTYGSGGNNGAKGHRGARERVEIDGIPNCPKTFSVTGTKDGYTEQADKRPASYGPAQVACAGPGEAPFEVHLVFVKNAAPAPPTTGTFSRAQIRDLQGDLLPYIAELAPPSFTERGGTWDPEIRMNRNGDGGYVARGIIEGRRMWVLTLDRYPKAKRTLILRAYRAMGYTHWPIQVTANEIGPGYHGVFPLEQVDVDGQGARLNAIADEVREAGLIPGASGVAPGYRIAPGLDRSKFLWVMNNWDDGRDDDEAILAAMYREFPHAASFLELPEDQFAPKRNGVEVPLAESGAWIRLMRQRYPNWVGMIHETSLFWGGTVASVAEKLRRYHEFFHDVPEWAFETDTYIKMSDGGDGEDAYRRRNDELLAIVGSGRPGGWIIGSFSGATPHPPPADEAPPVGGGRVGDMVDPASLTWYDAPNISAWPQTTTITRLELNLTGVHLEFSKQDGPNRWPPVRPAGWGPDPVDPAGIEHRNGDLQYSLGMCLKVTATWSCSAPIEYWFGRKEAGGDTGGIQEAGQIARNWHYDQRWGPLRGYQPQPGEEIVLFVHAGSSRSHAIKVQERSNFVRVKLPSPGVPATFTWSE